MGVLAPGSCTLGPPSTEADILQKENLRPGNMFADKESKDERKLIKSLSYKNFTARYMSPGMCV